MENPKKTLVDVMAETLIMRCIPSDDKMEAQEEIVKVNLRNMMNQAQNAGFDAAEFSQTLFGTICATHTRHLMDFLDHAPVVAEVNSEEVTRAILNKVAEASIHAAKKHKAEAKESE